jgi:outer membrane protein assembly factor BamB
MWCCPCSSGYFFIFLFHNFIKTLNMKKDVLYILSNGRAAAINKKDGSIVWEVKLKEYAGSSMINSIGQITVEGDKIFIGSGGILLCLAAKDGAFLWKNELKGWGYNFISFANVGSDAAGAAMLAAAASAIGTSTSAT